jgi:hypothetical protein
LWKLVKWRDLADDTSPFRESLRIAMDDTFIEHLKTGSSGPLIVSPAAAVRWHQGQLIISSVESGKAISTDNLRLLQVLHAFALPRVPPEVFQELSSLGQAFLFSAVAGLMNAKVLIEASEVSGASLNRLDKLDTPAHKAQVNGATGDRALAEAASRTAQEHTETISKLARTVAGDLWGFGADVHRDASRDDSESKLVSRLGELRRALSEIAAELRERRAPYLATQLSRLNLSSEGGLKLNLGSGRSRIEGWLNVDVPPADLQMHLNWGLPFAEGVARYVYLSHVLEHFYKREALEVLRDAHRVLALGGIARLVVPDIEKCMRAYVQKDESYFETRRRLWSVSSESAATSLELVLKNAGAGVKPESIWGHKQGYDFETLSHILRQAGFTSIARSEYMESKHADLRVDAASRIAGHEHEEIKFSMFVEATK